MQRSRIFTMYETFTAFTHTRYRYLSTSLRRRKVNLVPAGGGIEAAGRRAMRRGDGHRVEDGLVDPNPRAVVRAQSGSGSAAGASWCCASSERVRPHMPSTCARGGIYARMRVLLGV